MDLTEQWASKIALLADEFEGFLVTGSEFDLGLHRLIEEPNSPLTAIKYHLHLESPFESQEFGTSSKEDATDTSTLSSFDNCGSVCKISVWLKPESGVESTLLINALKHLFLSFWKVNRRDRFRLISYQYPETLSLLEHSLVRELPDRSSFLLFCDLDEFKKLNDALGEAAGDRVILEVAAVLQKQVSSFAIPLHRSGDEFAILFSAREADEALTLARRVMESISEHEFTLDQVDNSEKVTARMSVGIGVSTGSGMMQYEALEEQAEKGLKPGESWKREKKRGKARFVTTEEPVSPLNNDFSRNTSLCLIKSCLHLERPFESPWLNMISMTVGDVIQGEFAKFDNVSEGINKLINWIEPERDERVLRSALQHTLKRELSPVFSGLDIAIAVAHGVFRAALLSDPGLGTQTFLEIRYDGTGNCKLSVQPSDTNVLEIGNLNAAQEVWDLGGFVYSSIEHSSVSQDSRRALLIKIGHFDLAVPSQIFVEEIVVDDRPTKGGGLPDFWEATIARLIARMNENRNIAAVFVMGAHQFGAQTIAKLREIDYWERETEQLAYKTGMPSQSIVTAANGLKGKVHFPHTEQELVAGLAGTLLDSYTLESRNLASRLNVRTRFLQRDVNLNSMALSVNDGCRIGTIAQAFPTVLELARKVSSEDIVIDQAGQELRELVDFKVHLTNPTQDLVPTFYTAEQDSLEEYFNNQFLSKTGLFGRVFEDKQLQIVLRHLADAITSSKLPFSTRRAVLIIPLDLSDEDFTPLGLISIRIIPRFRLDRVILHYSYTWRTVEALVGFPYSLYGSVRYSQYLTEELKKLLPKEYERRISMGEVSYIAHSLHIFMDEHGQNIARRIVEDATF